jgi:hypothetical protein
MSEVDRLSNSGLFPALPIADRRTSKDDKERDRAQKSPDKPAAKSDTAEPGRGPQPPKSHIDEYA